MPEGTYKAVAILTGSQFISNCGFGCVIPVLPLFAAEMGLGPSGVGLILSTTAVSRLLVSGVRAYYTVAPVPIDGSVLFADKLCTAACWVASDIRPVDTTFSAPLFLAFFSFTLSPSNRI